MVIFYLNYRTNKTGSKKNITVNQFNLEALKVSVLKAVNIRH